MKKIAIDLSMNAYNPYCGISDDTKIVHDILSKDFAKEFKLQKFILPKTNRISHFLNILGSNLNISFVANKIRALLGIKTKIDTTNTELFYCSTVNNYKLDSPTKKVIRIHDLIPLTHPHLVPLESSLLFKKNLSYNLGEKDNFYVCNSNSTKQHLVTHFPQIKNKVFVVPCQTNILEIAQDKNHLILPHTFSLIIAALEPKKNLYRFLLVWKQAYENSQDIIPLVIVANQGWKSAKARTLLLELQKKYPDKVIHIQNVDNATICYLYKNCQYFIMPSIIEGFGLPVLNAIKFAKPAILSNIDAFKEVAGQAALYFDPNNINDIANKIIQINNNDDLQKKLSQNAKLQGKQFADNVISKSWRQVIKQILSDAK